MPTSPGGSAVARAAGTDDVESVPTFLSDARNQAAACATSLASLCHGSAPPEELLRAAYRAYLSAGVLLALLNRLPKLK